MSNKVTFSTHKYVQDEIAKIKQGIEEYTNEGLNELKQTHGEDIKKLQGDIENLKKTVNDDLANTIKETNETLQDMKDSIDKDLENLSKGILVENIAYSHPEYGDISNVKNALDKLLYTDLVILFNTTQPLVNEMGSTISDLTFTWEYNRVINTQNIDGIEIHKDSRIYRYPSNITTDRTVTLSVNDSVKDYSKSISFTFLNGLYYGVANESEYNSEFILNLSKKLTKTKETTFTVNSGTNQHIFYCIPVRFGTPAISVDGFSGGFDKVATIEFTNASGYTEPYAIWKSTNSNLGNTTVTVK